MPHGADSTAPAAAATDEHAHVHSAPHDGALVELGDEFAHLELVLDAPKGRLTAYVLDGEAEGAILATQREIRLVLTAIDSRVTTLGIVLRGQPNTLSDETEERTSVFAADVPELVGATTYAGRIAFVALKGERFDSLEFEGNSRARAGR